MRRRQLSIDRLSSSVRQFICTASSSRLSSLARTGNALPTVHVLPTYRRPLWRTFKTIAKCPQFIVPECVSTNSSPNCNLAGQTLCLVPLDSHDDPGAVTKGLLGCLGVVVPWIRAACRRATLLPLPTSLLLRGGYETGDLPLKAAHDDKVLGICDLTVSKFIVEDRVNVAVLNSRWEGQQSAWRRRSLSSASSFSSSSGSSSASLPTATTPSMRLTSGRSKPSFLARLIAFCHGPNLL